jgi:hypothetical protein
MKKKRIPIIIAAVLLVALLSGCSLNLESLSDVDVRALILGTATPNNTPQATVPPTATKTLITFQTFTPSPVGAELTNAPPTAVPTLRPSWTPFPTRTSRPTWTASPTWTPSPTVPPTPTPEVVPLFSAYFTDPEANWYRASGSNWSMGIEDGWYVMEITEPNVEIGSSQSWLTISDVRVEADIMLKEGDGYYGFGCRETGSNYYTIFITPEGGYGFGLTRLRKVNVLKRGFSSAIKQGSGRVNRVRGECRGETLTLYVNGQFVDQIVVEGIGAGFTSMMIGTRLDHENLRVRFDNLRVWGPTDWEMDSADPEATMTVTPTEIPTNTPTETP